MNKEAFSQPADREDSPISSVVRFVKEAIVNYLRDRQQQRYFLGRVALATVGELGVDYEKSDSILFARGGNFKVVRANLINCGKANSRQPMSDEQRKLRRRKRKKK
jgi:hypothetical protein